jgi:flagellar assembly protein FliH
MSSKVLTGLETEAAQPVDWRRVPVAPPKGPHLYSETEPEPPREPTEEERREFEAQVAEAHRRGFREGETAGSQAAAARIDAMVQQMARSIEEVAGARARLRREAEVDLVRLAISIARRILRREIGVDPDALNGVARAALERIAARENCRVRVHPSHAQGVSRCLQSAGVRAELVPDSGLPPGGLVFETAGGILDAGVETQFAEIERGLTDLCRRTEQSR